jgi:hypothetical protein
MQSLLWPTFAPPHLGRLGGLNGRGMTTSKKWYDPKFEAARAYMDLMETVAGRHAVRFLEPNMLDGITKIAAVKSKNEPHGELVHLTATLERLLGDTQLLISEDLQHSLRNAYERAESLAFPAAVAYRDLCHRLHGVTSSFHLQAMGLEQMQVLDQLGSTDNGAAVLHRNLLNKLHIAQEATDAALTRSLAQTFEAFAEAWAYRRLSRCVKISKIPEVDDPGPDFRCELDGREFFVELKAPDVVDGDLHHEQLMKASTEAQIDLDKQVRSGKRVAMVDGSIDPFRKPGDANYDPTDLTLPIKTLRERARGLFKASQFSLGPTFALMFVARYPIPGNRRAILPDYKVGGMWAAVPVDRQSGVIWQAAFGQAGNVIHNLTSPKRTLSGTPFLLDHGRPFPGAAFIAMTEIHKGSAVGTTECWGLLDRKGTQPEGWLLHDSEMVLNAICDVWNDGHDSRPKWLDE